MSYFSKAHAVKNLTAHRERIAACNTFEEFKVAQLMYVDGLIGEMARDKERALHEAREIFKAEYPTETITRIETT